MVKKCEHKKTYKLFYMDCKPRRWIRTDYSICRDCGAVVIKQNKEIKYVK